jgi:hypothetical protein
MPENEQAAGTLESEQENAPVDACTELACISHDELSTDFDEFWQD